MNMANATLLLTGGPSVSLADQARAVIYRLGWGKLEFLAFEVLSPLSNVIFLLWATFYYFFAKPPKEKIPQKERDSIELIKLSVAAWLLVVEVAIPAMDSCFGKTGRRNFTINDAMPFCSAFMTYAMLTVEVDGGYEPSKFIFYYSVLWTGIDFVKLWTYIFHDEPIMVAGTYVTARLRYLIVLAQLALWVMHSKYLCEYLDRADNFIAEQLRKAREAARATARAETAQQDAAQMAEKNFMAPPAPCPSQAQRKRKTAKTSRRKAE
ncbi:hypothetical protein NLG97_g10903 [Lecanicillium saksenae]|uniref:Uncharacterized protein n=1 Tax=Lecanicillium saksenae TaxID=468837 RepID=A0ACC1QDL1_9HYPO|nr:hypothetical protein NLG97_g10903 [Lecanicillium saksenae]